MYRFCKMYIIYIHIVGFIVSVGANCAHIYSTRDQIINCLYRVSQKKCPL